MATTELSTSFKHASIKTKRCLSLLVWLNSGHRHGETVCRGAVLFNELPDNRSRLPSFLIITICHHVPDGLPDVYLQD